MWVGVNEYNPQDICPICHEDYGTTQAIFKTPCGHFFHNNCLLGYCDANQGDIECPMCRSDIAEYCNDVYAFKERLLGDPDGSPLFEDDKNDHILNIYNNQEGGKKRRNSKKRNSRKRNTRNRNSRNRNSRKRNSRKRNKKY